MRTTTHNCATMGSMYDTRRIETLAKQRTRILAQLANVEARLKAELCAARSAPKDERPNEEPLAVLVGITRTTLSKWVREAHADGARP